MVLLLDEGEDYNPRVVTFRPFDGPLPTRAANKIREYAQKYPRVQIFVFEVDEDQEEGPTFSYEDITDEEPLKEFHNVESFLEWCAHIA
jgi:hypothetical protein